MAKSGVYARRRTVAKIGLQLRASDSVELIRGSWKEISDRQEMPSFGWLPEAFMRIS